MSTSAAIPTETQLVHEIANTAWCLNRIPFLEAELLSQDPNPQSLIPQLATPGLHGPRLPMMASFFQNNKSSTTHDS